jgi:hypothetical protein
MLLTELSLASIHPRSSGTRSAGPEKPADRMIFIEAREENCIEGSGNNIRATWHSHSQQTTKQTAIGFLWSNLMCQ